MGIGRDGYLASIDSNYYLLPFNYIGNQFAINNLFEGKNVDIAKI